MKKILLCCLLLVQTAVFGQKNDPYTSLTFDKVIMYDFEPNDKGGSIVEASGKLTKGISKEIQLDKPIIDRLNAKLGDKHSFNFGTAACFDPHLGFVYYKNNKIVGYITICLSCNKLYPNINLPAQMRGDRIDDKATGMSKSFRKFLNEQLKRHKFSNQIEPGSPFDK